MPAHSDCADPGSKGRVAAIPFEAFESCHKGLLGEGVSLFRIAGQPPGKAPHHRQCAGYEFRCSGLVAAHSALGQVEVAARAGHSFQFSSQRPAKEPAIPPTIAALSSPTADRASMVCNPNGA